MGQIKRREIRLLNSDSGSNEEKISYCQECENEEMESSDAEMDLANDEKKLADLESEKHLRTIDEKDKDKGEID